MDIQGIYPPITTPFREDGSVDLDALRFNVQRWNETGLSGYVVLGSNGENVFLDDGEKLQVLEAVVKASADKQVIAGTGCEATAATVRLTGQAAEAGAQAALVVNPHYFSLSQQALVDHYTTVADESPIPVLVYNVPKFTGANIPAAVVIRLAEHPNIVGIKDSSGNVTQISEILQGTPEDFRVLSGTANVLYAVCALGGAGAVTALANVAPEPCVELLSLLKEGKHLEARELQLRLLAPNTAVTATYGIPGLKHAMDLCGYRGGYPRRPLRPLPPEAQQTLRTVLQDARIL